MTYKSTLAVLSLVLAPFAAFAQEEAITVSIDFVAWGNDIGGLYMGADKNKETFTARAFNYSSSVQYTGPALLKLYKTGNGDVKVSYESLTDEERDNLSRPLLEGQSNDEASANGQLPEQLAKLREGDPSLVALVALPTNGSSHVTVLLAPAAEGTLMSYVIDDDSAELPLGHIRVRNLSPVPIMMRFDRKVSREIPSRGSVTMPVEKDYVIYELAYKEGEKWRMHENNIIRVSPGEQTQMFVLRSNNSYFTSSDGSTGGFLQKVTLRRGSEK